jgi:hypothetical protein
MPINVTIGPDSPCSAVAVGVRIGAEIVGVAEGVSPVGVAPVGVALISGVGVREGGVAVGDRSVGDAVGPGGVSQVLVGEGPGAEVSEEPPQPISSSSAITHLPVIRFSRSRRGTLATTRATTLGTHTISTRR